MSMVPNRPSPEGYALGEQIARLTDGAEAEQLRQFPNMRERCGTCAFRKGTIPNGCLPTLHDAMKCIMENDLFFCHEKPAGQDAEQVCAGYMTAVSALRDMPKTKVPWDYSIVDEADRVTGPVVDEEYVG